ncbi:hypothetical protein CRE_02611 [Caenorhabditis remanei]|uniref:Uncharacterized protein n=1 Tax=Caenorhabditis remanei TaxID=31234 RepID=E3N9V1_CAERE|nr:hypothetical protein CRE_02611 [Caenorhabditis remanei]
MMLNIIVSTTILSLSSIKDTDGTGFIFEGFFTMAFWTNVYQNLSISRIVELLDQQWIVMLASNNPPGPSASADQQLDYSPLPPADELPHLQFPPREESIVNENADQDQIEQPRCSLNITMTEESENTPKIEPEVKKTEETEKVETESVKEEVKDWVPEMYRSHGGDPRSVNLNFAVLLSHISTDLITDSYEQFDETIRTMLKMGHNLNSDNIVKVIRIPMLEDGAPNKNSALRALICFSDKIQQCRCLARKAKFEEDQQKVEAIESLPESFLFISEEDRQILENGVHEQHEEEEENDDVGEEVDEMMEEEEGHDEHEEDDEHEDVKKEEEKKETKESENKKSSGDVKSQKPEEPKKKVYEDDDEKAPFEMQWEGAPEFQWRLCDGARDEKKLIIENVMWADLQDVFIYRTIQKATLCETSFPTRYSNEGQRPVYGKLTLIFPGFVAIMDEALKHLIYFRSGDNRRIKVFLPQTTVSLKRKEEFEGKLGRLIKPTQRMMELVIKILPDGYVPTLDDACQWFPDQSVIGCELVQDEMGKPCAIVRFETAQEAVAAHASKSFVFIGLKGEEVKKEETIDDKDDSVVEEKRHRCNVFMRGVEAHFGSYLTFYDQRKKAQEQSRQNRQKRGGPGPSSTAAQKRPAGSTIRGPVQKKRAISPKRAGGAPRDSTGGTPRGGNASRSAPRGGSGGGGGARRPSSPVRSSRQTPRGNVSRGGQSTRGGSGSTPRGGGASRGGSGRGGRTGDRGMSRSAPRSSNSNYRSDSFSSSSQRQQPRTDAFSGYGYAHFDSRYGASGSSNDRPAVDPFGRPMYSDGKS